MLSSAVGESRSLYRPTRTMVLAFFNVLETAWKCKDGLVERVSTCGINLIVGSDSLPPWAVLLVEGMAASVEAPAAKGATTVAALALVMLSGLWLVSRCAVCVSVLVRSTACLLSPLRP